MEAATAQPNVIWTGATPLMDICAEATLRVTRTAQGRSSSQLAAGAWFLMPEFREATWDDARTALSVAPKPIIVTPLLEPGHVGFWSFNGISAMSRSAAEKQLSNQQSYCMAKLRSLGLSDAHTIIIPSAEADFAMPREEFDRWLAEYAIGLGTTLQRAVDPGTARLLLRPPGGGGPPLGWIPEVPPTAS